MAIAKKITDTNHLPGAGNDRHKVYSKQFNALVDVVNELEPTDGILVVDGVKATAQAVNPAADGLSGSTILPGVTSVDVGAVVNGVTDYITLPALADVPVGHTITILCNAGGAFEMRTPAASAEEINSEDCDGTKEYLMTDTQIVNVVKISDTIGWMAHGYSAIGAVVAAVVPD